MKIQRGTVVVQLNEQDVINALCDYVMSVLDESEYVNKDMTAEVKIDKKGNYSAVVELEDC